MMHQASDQPLKEQRLTWKSKYEQINAVHVTNGLEDSNSKDGIDNGTPVVMNNGDMASKSSSEVENGQVSKTPNALIGLTGYLSSSDDDSSSDGEDSELNSEVEAFLKEVDNIYAERRSSLPSKPPTPAAMEAKPSNPASAAADANPEIPHHGPPAPTVSWQECYDSSTGYAYYWNVDTNEVTWDMPIEYQMYLEAMKQWQQYQAQAEVAALMERARNQKLQLLSQQRQQQMLNSNQKLISKTLDNIKDRGQAINRLQRKRNSTKKSDSEDEKIELITSYGPNSGDESDSEQEPPAPTLPKVDAKLAAELKRKKKLQKIIRDTARRGSTDNSQIMGPQLPPGVSVSNSQKSPAGSLVPYRAETESDAKQQPVSKLLSNTKAGMKDEKKKDLSPSEDTDLALLDRLKSQTQVLKELGGEVPEEVKTFIAPKESSDLGSLVPSYSEGSEDDDDEQSAISNSKITTKESTKTSKPKNDDSNEGQQLYEPEEMLSPKSRADSPELLVETLPTAKRKFKLEIPSKSGDSGNFVLPESGKDDFKGLGFSSAEPLNKKHKTEKIMFVKAETLQFQNKAVAPSQDFTEDKEPSIDIKDISGVLLDKMKFLSAAKEAVSPVQVWTVQLETLLAAWESQNLRTSYFENWLTSMTKELETLEAEVAPEGWRCEWQRSRKCYSYRNVNTQLVVWEFPQREDKPACGGEEDMEVCTTPPPPPSPPKISPPTPPPPPALTPPPLPPAPPTISSSKDIPPLPPLPPMPPPPQLPTPPPPPPDEPPPPPPPDLSLSEPLPPGVDPPDVHPPPSAPMPTSTQPLEPYAAMHLHHVPMVPGMPHHQMHYPIAYPAVPMAPSPMSNIVLTPTSRPADAHNLTSELDSFYSDIASLEPEVVPQPPPGKEPSPPPKPPSPTPSSPGPVDPSSSKKKKKTKLAPGLSLKKKGVSSLVAKWQQVQEDVRRDLN